MPMGDLSANFSRHEFACKCGCGFDSIDAGLIDALQYLRDKTGRPITITSGCRCARHNRRVKGARNSLHTRGEAADIKVAGLSPTQVYRMLDARYPRSHGIGRYRTWVHLDVRPGRARW
jgi:uncharacterized protein YcbK (DUF882 family)